MAIYYTKNANVTFDVTYSGLVVDLIFRFGLAARVNVSFGIEMEICLCPPGLIAG